MKITEWFQKCFPLGLSFIPSFRLDFYYHFHLNWIFCLEFRRNLMNGLRIHFRKLYIIIMIIGIDTETIIHKQEPRQLPVLWNVHLVTKIWKWTHTGIRNEIEIEISNGLISFSWNYCKTWMNIFHQFHRNRIDAGIV